jgi:soluble lytic murein transglycosylase-like protein
MVLQAEQMRAEELKADTELLEDLKDSGNEKAFQSERERICQKWSNVERLSPTPIQPGHIPELMPIPAQLPCSSSETNTTSLSAEVRQPLQRALTDTAVARTAFRNSVDETAWLQEMSRRLANVILDEDERLEFLTILHWEASRAGVDPQLMLGLIEIESGFNQYAVSPQGARGYTQVMPFWVQEIGSPDHDLFQLRTNLRYGALILRHYIDIEKGDLFRALGRYDGNLGRPDFPNLVVGAWKRNWDYSPASKPKSETQ